MEEPKSSADAQRTSIRTALEEALCAVVSRELARDVLVRSLSALGMRELPIDAVSLRLLVSKVRGALEARVGSDEAAAIDGELQALVRVVDSLDAVSRGGVSQSGSIPREVHRTPTRTSPTAPEHVLVVSREAELAARLRPLLGGVPVDQTSTLEGLRFLLRRIRPAVPVVVLDARARVSAPGLASRSVSSNGVPSAAGLVLWGSCPPDVSAWAWLEPPHVVPCSEEVELADLATLLLHAMRRVA